jgi:hypothetical protein
VPTLADGLAARFVVFPHAGHALPIQCARGLNVTLAQHVAGVEAALRSARCQAGV